MIIADVVLSVAEGDVVCLLLLFFLLFVVFSTCSSVVIRSVFVVQVVWSFTIGIANPDVVGTVVHWLLLMSFFQLLFATLFSLLSKAIPVWLNSQCL